MFSEKLVVGEPGDSAQLVREEAQRIGAKYILYKRILSTVEYVWKPVEVVKEGNNGTKS